MEMDLGTSLDRGDVAMDGLPAQFGERLVDVVRLAVAEHLRRARQESSLQSTHSGGAGRRIAVEEKPRRIAARHSGGPVEGAAA